MKKTILITTLFILSLTACSNGAVSGEQAPTSNPVTDIVVQPSPTPLPDADRPVQDEEVETQDPIQDAEPTVDDETKGLRTFKIVAGESSVTYEVGEVFIREGNVFNMAVGITNDINGEIQIDYDNPQDSTIGPISVDISKFTSDSGRRDRAIQGDWLESATYPIATFTPTRIEGIPEVGEEGMVYGLKIDGDLTIRDVTREVTFDATVQVDNDILSGTATTTLLMSDYGIGPIDIIGILKTEDEVKLTFNIIAREITN